MNTVKVPKELWKSIAVGFTLVGISYVWICRPAIWSWAVVTAKVIPFLAAIELFSSRGHLYLTRLCLIWRRMNTCGPAPSPPVLHSGLSSFSALSDYFLKVVLSSRISASISLVDVVTCQSNWLEVLLCITQLNFAASKILMILDSIF